MAQHSDSQNPQENSYDTPKNGEIFPRDDFDGLQAAKGHDSMSQNSDSQLTPEGEPTENYSAPNNSTDPANGQTDRTARNSHTEAAEEDLLHFLKTGKLPAIFSDDPAFVAQMLSPQGDSTFDEVVADHNGYRAARRQLCAQVLRFAAAVIEDEARRGQSLTGLDAAAVSTIGTILADPAITSTAPAFVVIHDRPNDPTPAGVDPQLWAQAGRVEDARILACYHAMNDTEEHRAWEAMHAGKCRSEAPTDVQTERENAWHIALQAAVDLDYDARIAADPSLDPDYDPSPTGIMRGIARLFVLSDEEAEAVETAAQALRKLPQIGYRARKSTDKVSE